MPIMPSPSELSLCGRDILSTPEPGHRRTNSSFASSPIARTPCYSTRQLRCAEDYYTAESENEGSLSFETDEPCVCSIPSAPRPATLASHSFQGDIPSASGEGSSPSRQNRTHQRSLTAFLPSLRPIISRASSQSPERRSQNQTPSREKLGGDFMPTLTGDLEGKIKVADRSRGFASWFSGSSAPVQIGLPVIEQVGGVSESTSPSRPASPERLTAKLAKRRPTVLESSAMVPATPPKAASAGGGSRFSFFSNPKTPVQPTFQVPAELNGDELLTIDIQAALFPAGPPIPQDAFSPSSFKNLLMNAEGLLDKLQSAYKARTLTLHALEQERNVQHDELEEANTRAECLRAQLDALAARVTAQDQDLQDLAARLESEQKARADEKAAREKSIALVRSAAIDQQHRDCECSVDDDLGIATATPSRSKHKRGSATSSTDLSGESDAESLFSRSRSSTLTVSGVASSIMTTDSTPEVRQAAFGRVVKVHSPSGDLEKRRLERPGLVHQPSTFQKILKGMAGDSRENTVDGGQDGNGYGGIGESETGCENCRGKKSSLAWDAVGLLKAENRGLKERVGALESAVEGALDLVAGIGRI